MAFYCIEQIIIKCSRVHFPLELLLWGFYLVWPLFCFENYKWVQEKHGRWKRKHLDKMDKKLIRYVPPHHLTQVTVLIKLNHCAARSLMFLMFILFSKCVLSVFSCQFPCGFLCSGCGVPSSSLRLPGSDQSSCPPCLLSCYLQTIISSKYSIHNPALHPLITLFCTILWYK